MFFMEKSEQLLWQKQLRYCCLLEQVFFGLVKRELNF